MDNSSHLTKSLFISKNVFVRLYAVRWAKGARCVGNNKYNQVTSGRLKTGERSTKNRKKVLCYCNYLFEVKEEPKDS